MMMLSLSTEKDCTFKGPSKQQVEGSLQELMLFTHNHKL